MAASNHPYPSEPTRTLFLKGSDREMGQQHGEQVGPASRQGMVKFYGDFWKRMLGVKGNGFVSQNAIRVGKVLLERLLVDRLIARVPDWARERLQGCADSTGNDYDEMLTILVLPDLLPILQAYLTKIRPRTFVEAAPPPRFGCSSFIAIGRQFLHGRNLDFPGVAYWDRFPVIQLMQKPGCLRTVSFTTAGVPIGGITGINEAQISVSLHQHYCAKTSVKGTLPFIIGEEILFKAKSLTEAMEILKSSRVSSSWAFIVADGKTRRGFIYESHPRAAGVSLLTEDNPILSHSNFFQTPECRPAEYATSCRMNWDNYWRKNRLQELVASKRGELTAPEAALFMSDHYDPYWGEEKTFNRTVSQVYNIQSMVLDSQNMKVLFAEGDAPIHLREYREYDLGSIFAGRGGATGKVFPAYQFKSEAKRLAKADYILSFIAAFDGRLEEARGGLGRSLSHDFSNEGAMVAAVLDLKEGRYESALDLLQAAKKNIETKMTTLGKKAPPPEYFEIELYLARTYDLLGERAKAVKLYQSVATHRELQDINVKRIAAAEGPYTQENLKRVLMPYSSYIPFE